MWKVVAGLLLILCSSVNAQLWLPVNVKNRASTVNIKLTNIGRFGLLRKARPNVPAHYHTGIDIRRPSNNYVNEPVYAAGAGKVISVREDGPFSQIIIEHIVNPGDTLWTVYEHILGITCHMGTMVFKTTMIARFFSKEELNKYGWQFDHVHFEIMKVKPVKVKPTLKFPEHRFKTYAITCYTPDQLRKRMMNPEAYFREE